jgi:hypothetical protein
VWERERERERDREFTHRDGERTVKGDGGEVERLKVSEGGSGRGACNQGYSPWAFLSPHSHPLFQCAPMRQVFSKAFFSSLIWGPKN